MKAKNKTEFIASWEEEINILYLLAQSLPNGKTSLEYLEKVKDLRQYIMKAANHTYGVN